MDMDKDGIVVGEDEKMDGDEMVEMDANEAGDKEQAVADDTEESVDIYADDVEKIKNKDNKPAQKAGKKEDRDDEERDPDDAIKTGDDVNADDDNVEADLVADEELNDTTFDPFYCIACDVRCDNEAVNVNL